MTQNGKKAESKKKAMSFKLFKYQSLIVITW